jgi:hypothetical protein
MTQRSDEVKRDMNAFMMVVLIVAMAMGYLLSRSRWLTSEKGDRLSPLSRNRMKTEVKLTFANIIINVNRSKSKK